MIDLHLHSTHSDGTLSPTELVEMACKNELLAIAITDHDTVSGITEAQQAGVKNNIGVIAGVELSVESADGYFHLLGYDFDHEHPRIIDALEKLQHSRMQRNLEMLERLKDMGIKISFEELKKESQIGQIGRPHIAKVLRQKGLVKSIDQAFDRYLRKGKPAYVSREILSLNEAIALLKQAGGKAVLAHPVQIGYSIDKIKGLLKKMKSTGLDGIETYYPTQKGRVQRQLTKIAEELALLETGGSDYHGDIRANTGMAGKGRLEVPDALYYNLLI
ncbi:MAG: PHP domain-containing protein [Desulfobulbaceae bacterium]|nr:MAG: PHP domain-containing protein [Desulfobulbaceae bacterium]